jgi:hypothetical protein
MILVCTEGGWKFDLGIWVVKLIVSTLIPSCSGWHESKRNVLFQREEIDGGKQQTLMERDWQCSFNGANNSSC